MPAKAPSSLQMVQPIAKRASADSVNWCDAARQSGAKAE
jgi:hypothetical protein